MSRTSKWWIISSLVIFLLVIYYLGSVLIPFLIAALIAYLTDPLVSRLVNLKVPRTIAVSIVFVFILFLIFLLFFFLVPLLEKQIALLISKIPELIAWVQTSLIPWVAHLTGIKEIMDLTQMKKLLTEHWEEAGNVATTVIKTITTSGYTFIGFLINLVLIPVVTFYLLRDWRKLVVGIQKLIPRHAEGLVVKLVLQCDEVISAFFRGQLLVMVALAIYYSIALWITGIELALLFGLIIGIISIVPYLGFFVGIVVTLIVAAVQFQDWLHIVYILIVFGIGSCLENFILAPLLVGDRIGLHPVAVIFAILAGGALFGFIGVLLALPVAAMIMVFLRYICSRYYESELYTAE